MEYEQIKMDVTLSSERSLKDNIQKVAEFAIRQQRREGLCRTRVRNRHEGYGIAAEYYSICSAKMKCVDANMKAMLTLLSNGEGDFIDKCATLYDSAINMAVSAVCLAAQSQRILDDLYDSETRTPMDDYFDEADSGETAGEDGKEQEQFEDAEPAEASEAADDDINNDEEE